MIHANDQTEFAGSREPSREKAVMDLVRRAYIYLQGHIESGEQARDRHAAALREIRAVRSVLYGQPVLRAQGQELAYYVADSQQLHGKIAYLQRQRDYAAQGDRRALRAFHAERMRYHILINDALAGSVLTLEAQAGCPGFSLANRAPERRAVPTQLIDATYVGCSPESGALLLRDSDGMDRIARLLVPVDNGADRYAVARGAVITHISNPALDYL